MKSPIRNVVLIMSTSGAAGRELLSGVFDYAKWGQYWNVRLIQPPCPLMAEILARFADEDVHGILTYDLGEAVAGDTLLDSPIPLVLIGSRDARIDARRAPTAFVVSDDRKIGQMGARHLCELGRFKSFAFVSAARDWSWNDERAHGFSDYLGARGLSVRRFRASESAADRSALLDWLKSLPKPAAVMAAWDTTAVAVVEALHKLGVDIPQRVVVVGVDNDELLCDFADPPLTSVWPDHHRMGFLAAQELARMMAQRARRPTGCRMIVCPPKCLVERESTRALPPAAHLVERAMVYIDRNATLGIGVSDVVAHLRISRRLADLRFRETSGKSIHEAITERRLAEVCRHLERSRKSAASIAAVCGFGNAKHLMRLFRKRFGVTMRTYRANCASRTSSAG